MEFHRIKIILDVERVYQFREFRSQNKGELYKDGLFGYKEVSEGKYQINKIVSISNYILSDRIETESVFPFHSRKFILIVVGLNYAVLYLYIHKLMRSAVNVNLFSLRWRSHIILSDICSQIIKPKKTRTTNTIDTLNEITRQAQSEKVLFILKCNHRWRWSRGFTVLVWMGKRWNWWQGSERIMAYVAEKSFCSNWSTRRFVTPAKKKMT